MMKKKDVIKKAFLKSVPVLAGYVILGFGFGLLLNKAGYGVLWALAMSVLIYAGSMQYVGIGLLSGGASVITTFFTTIMVNARHLFYGISMIGKYKDAGKYKPYLYFALTDETYSLLSDGYTPDKEHEHMYRFFVSLFNQCYWVAGSVLGSIFGTVFSIPSKGIEFSMTALFIAAFTEQWREGNRFSALTGLLCTFVCLLLLGPDRFLIPSMVFIILVLSFYRNKEKEVRDERKC